MSGVVLLSIFREIREVISEILILVYKKGSYVNHFDGLLCHFLEG